MMTTETSRGRSSLHSTARYLGRTMLALLGFTVLLFPAAALVAPPDPFTQLFVLVGAMPLLLVAAVGYVHLGKSVRRLGWFIVAVHVLVIPLWVPYAAFIVLVHSIGIPYGLIDVLGQGIVLLVDYAGAYYLVYRGGYERLRARLVGLL